MTNLGQLITAMITPFTTSGDVHYTEAVRVATHLVNNGTDTVLLSGTTGESPTLTHEEEFTLYKTIIDALPNQSIMVGTGSNSTKTAVEATQKAEELGATASLQVVPYYNKPSQAGLYQHFKTIASETTLPILLYNIPGRTGTNLEPDTIAKLAELPTIIGIKEAAGSVTQLIDIKNKTPDQFQLYSGDDALTLDFLKNGAIGVVSVASHIVGPHIKTMIQNFTDGDLSNAEVLEQTLMPIFNAMFITTNPVPVKFAMSYLGFEVGAPRLPLIDLTQKEKERLTLVLDSNKHLLSHLA